MPNSRIVALTVSLGAMLIAAGCGSDSERQRTIPTRSPTNIPNSTSTATFTQTPGRTRTPTDSPTTTPTGTVTPTRAPETLTYVLSDGSRLVYKLRSRGDQVEPLTGSMEVIAREGNGDSLFDLRIIHFDFESENFHLTGVEGVLIAAVQNGADGVSMEIVADISGGFARTEGVGLSGGGSGEVFTVSPPTLRGLRLFGSHAEGPNTFTIILTMFSEPVG